MIRELLAFAGELTGGSFCLSLRCTRNYSFSLPISFVSFWTWYFQGLDGQSDPNSIHGGCEVLSGEKWSATKWMRQRVTS